MVKQKHLLPLVMTTALVCSVSLPPNLTHAAVPANSYLADFHLTPKALTYRYKNIDMAEHITAYNYIGGMLMPLSFTADAMGSYIAVDAREGIAEGWIEKPDNAFKLDLAARLVTVGETERTIPQGVISVVGDEMYVDASYLATILPANFEVSPSVNEVAIEPHRELRVFQRLDFISRYFAQIRAQHAGEWGGAAGQPAQTILAQQPSTTSAKTSGPTIRPQTAAPSSSIAPAVPAGKADAAPEEGRRAPAATPGSAQTAGVSTTHSPPVSAEPASPSSPASESSVMVSADVPEDIEPSTPSTGIQVDTWNRVVLDTAKEDASLQAVANPMLDENRLLILLPKLGDVKGDYIEVYEHDGGFYLPLGHLMDILEIAIGVDPAALEASGFFVDEDKTFFLNGRTGEAVVNGEKITFPAGLVVANPFELYVDATLLSRLLPTNFELDMAELTLAIKPDVVLPIQARIKRENKWSKLSVWKEHGGYARMKRKQYPVVETPYKPVTAPFIDTRVTTDYGSQRVENKLKTRSTVLASGDLGYVNAEAFVSADSSQEDPITNLRVKAGREDRNGNLLGPLKAKEAYVGDIRAYPMPLVSSAELGRGVKVSNKDLRRTSLYDETDFFGDAQPGWEVELYQNNVLIDFQVVGEEGRYEFQNVPIFYGDNTFRIVLYGPQGQKQEEVREFNIDNEMPEPGEIEYSVSATEQQRSVFGVSDPDGFSGVQELGEGLALVGQAEYGINHRLSARVGAAHLPVRDALGNVGTYNFASAGIKASLMGWNTVWDVAYDVDNGGWAGKVTGFYRYKGANIRASQRIYNDFTSAEYARSIVRPLTLDEILSGLTDERIASDITSRTEFNVSQIFDLPFLSNVSTSFNMRHEEFERGESDSSFAVRLSKNMKGTNVTNDLRVRRVSGTQSSDEEVLDGTFSVRHRFGDSLLRAAARYEIAPETELTGMTLSLQHKLTDKLNGRVDYTHALGGVNRQRLSTFLNWDMDHFFLSPRFEIDQDREWVLGLDLLFSLGMDERTRQWQMASQRIATAGAVSAMAFVDENADGVKGEDEPAIPGVRFKGGRTVTAGEDGVAFITNMTPYWPRAVSLDVTSLEGEIMSPAEVAYDVVGRPGVTTQLDYPVVPTVELEGIAYMEVDGENLEYPGLPLELVNQEGEVVRELRTEFDGYYYLQDIMPGKYVLRVAKELQERRKLVADDFIIDTIAIRSTDAGKYQVQEHDFYISQQERPMIEAQVAAMQEQSEEGMPHDLGAVPGDMPQDEGVSAGIISSAKADEPMLPEELNIASLAVAEQVSNLVTTLPHRPEPPESGRRVFVQTGLFCDYENAERRRETLSVAGFEAEIKGRNYQGRACFSVQVGPQQDLVAAEAVVQELQNMGFDRPHIVEESSEVYQ